MSIDFAFLNSCAMAIVVFVLMTIVLTLRKHLGPRWIAWGFEALLLTILLRRVDEIGLQFGIDLFDRTANILLSWLVIIVLGILFTKAWKRRYEIKRIEAGLKAREEYLEMLRKNHEHGLNWDRSHHLNV